LSLVAPVPKTVHSVEDRAQTSADRKYSSAMPDEATAGNLRIGMIMEGDPFVVIGRHDHPGIHRRRHQRRPSTSARKFAPRFAARNVRDFRGGPKACRLSRQSGIRRLRARTFESFSKCRVGTGRRPICLAAEGKPPLLEKPGRGPPAAFVRANKNHRCRRPLKRPCFARPARDQQTLLSFAGNPFILAGGAKGVRRFRHGRLRRHPCRSSLGATIPHGGPSFETGLRRHARRTHRRKTAAATLTGRPVRAVQVGGPWALLHPGGLCSKRRSTYGRLFAARDG